MVDSVLIVGAGISGLATAHYLRTSSPGLEITVLEASDHIGGKITTREVMGLPVDVGPDAFLARGADLAALIDTLDLRTSVTEPASGSYIWSRGRLRPIPAGAAFGLPERLLPLLRSGLLSPVGVARAGLDLVLPATQASDDPSIADLVRPRFGDDVYRRMVEPLLGGVHAGDPARLSARSTVPEIYALATKGRSITLTMRARRAPKPSGKRAAPLISLDGGLRRLTQALAIDLDVRTGVTVSSVDPGWTVHTNRGTMTADAVVLATPAYVSAALVHHFSTQLSQELSAIEYVDVANATLAFRPQDVPPLPPGTGFLVPPIEGRFIVGCSWLTQKWPHLASDDVVLIKSMVGRAGDQRWLNMNDEQIVGGIRQDLRSILGITAEPMQTLVQRWPQAMPQYVVGHAARLNRIAALTTPGLHLTGAAYGGSGLAACVTQARATAATITEGATQ